MNWYLAEVSELEKSIAARHMTCPVVFYGSSSFTLWKTLAADLGRNDVLNAGFGGSTLEACAYFFERIVVPAQPRTVVVYAGDNDLGDGRRTADVLRDFRELARKAETYLPGIPFYILSIKPSPARAAILDRIQRTNAALEKEAGTLRGFRYIDIHHAMLGPDGKPRPDLFQQDGLHMNAAGYRIWTDILQQNGKQIFGDT